MAKRELKSETKEITREETIQKKVDELKKKHSIKDVFVIEIPRDDEGEDIAVGYIRKPNRNELAAMASLQDNPIRATEVLLNSIWLDGDNDIKEDDDLFLSTVSQLEQIVKVRSAQLKKY